ncbi:MAG: hypothetical protein LBQ93_06795 [Treponema sp.]|nr:hypothetical protein [Treponema sp.]
MKKRLAAALAAICGALVFLAGWLLRGLFGRKTHITAACKTPEEVKRAIENTPADDLVSSAPDADQLRANAAGIAGRAKQRLRDRAGAIISGHAGTGTDGSGGSGD